MDRDVFVDAQASVIGSMLIDERCVPIVLQSVRAEYFTVGQYRTLFGVIRELSVRARPVDPVTVVDAAGQAYYDLVAQLIQITPTAANVREYCKILKREARMQLLKSAAAEMLDATDESAIRAAMDRINAVLVDRPGVQAMSMAQALADFYKRHDPAVKPDYLPWGFPKLDKILVAPGDLVYIGGYPSDGKTTLALMTAREQAKNKRVGFFSLETSCAKLTDAMVCAAAQIGLPAVQKNELKQSDWNMLASISGDFTARNLDIIDAAGMSASDIRLYALAHHYDVVYIDYVQLIAAPSRDRWVQDDFNKVSENSRQLKAFGRETGTTIVALSQMTRAKPVIKKLANGTEITRLPPPTMQNLRSSGQIEQDADVVLLLFREDPSKSNSDRIVTIGKVKTGAAGGSSYLSFDGAKQTFRDSPRNQKPSKASDQVSFEDLPRDVPVPF